MAMAGRSDMMTSDQFHGRPMGYSQLQRTVLYLEAKIKELEERLEKLDGKLRELKR